MRIPVAAHPVLPYLSNGSDVAWVDLANVAIEDLERVIARELGTSGKRYAIGGYGEDRSFYRRSPLFADAEGRYRSVHLGVDIWAPAGTAVFAPCRGEIHSWAYNGQLGDYGGTIVVNHGGVFALYGHLSMESLEGLYEGMPVAAGQLIATLGNRAENGDWVPHLHFQLIRDLEGRKGDYPGVAHREEADLWLAKSPDPNLLLEIPR